MAKKAQSTVSVLKEENGKKINPTPSSSTKWLPHAAAVGTFLVVTLIFFSPMIFNGKELFQSDILQFKGMSKEIANFREKNNSEPFWTNSAFCGMPSYQISAIYASSKLGWVNKIFSLGLPHPAHLIFFTFLGFYILLLTLGVSPWTSLLGALTYGFSSYFFIVIDTGHNSKMAAMAYMAPVLAGIVLIYKGRLMIGTALTALFFTMEFFCNHPQITYYLGFIIVAYISAEFFKAWKEKQLKSFFKYTAAVAFAGCIAFGANITGLLATANYTKYTIRGASELTINPDGSKKTNISTSGLDKDYATAWSYGVGETMTLLIPNIKGGASVPIGKNKDAMEKVKAEMKETVANMSSYFGDQPTTSGPVYAGAIVIFLFVLGLFIVKGPIKWALFIVTLFSIWLSWGRNDPFGLSNFMLDHFPGYNKFRAVAMTLVIAGLTVPLLSILAIDTLIKSKNFLTEKISVLKFQLSGMRVLLISFALTGGVALLCWLSPTLFTDLTSATEYSEISSQIKQSNPEVNETQINNYMGQFMPEVQVAREAMVKADAIRSFLFILLAGFVLFLFSKSKINTTLLISLLAVLVLFDMIAVDKRYLNNESFRDKVDPKNLLASIGRPTSADQEIMKDPDPNFRVWNTTARLDQDGITPYFYKSLSGYHGAKLRRYQELIDFHIYRRNMSVVNMLNTKYFIVGGNNNQPMVMPNSGTLGNAWFVNDVKLVTSADSEITALQNFDPAKTAIVNTKFNTQLSGFKAGGDSTSLIKLTSYKTNDLVYESNSTTEKLAVFSEIYYPDGWNAYIDGKLSPHFQVNYVLRAMIVPAGKHTIEFKFEPKIISTGEIISVACMLLLVSLLVTALFLWFKKNSKTDALAT